MKILLLSDSHGNLGPARRILAAEQPDMVLHLGDLQPDAQRLRAEFPALEWHSVPGNCDGQTDAPAVMLLQREGCRIFGTHGHLHGVKWSLLRLRMAAQEQQAQVAAFGHTHQPYCEYVDGVWLLNPGSCQRDACYALIELNGGAPACSLHRLPNV